MSQNKLPKQIEQTYSRTLGGQHLQVIDDVKRKFSMTRLEQKLTFLKDQNLIWLPWNKIKSKKNTLLCVCQAI